MILRDAGNGFEQIAEIDYGFTTPGGAKMPQSVAAKLVGSIEGGFVDPLQAKLAVPGYGGPLDFHVSVLTDELDAKFALGFDSMPESVFFSQQSRTDGLDASYSHTASVADVHLDAQATLIDRLTDDKQEIGANIERLPQLITLSTTKTKTGPYAGSTAVAYDSSSALSWPDVYARYRNTTADGQITDADLRIAGLPFHLRGWIDTTTTATGTDIDEVDFKVVDDVDANTTGNSQIDALDFTARNYSACSGSFLPDLGGEQWVAFASRRLSADRKRYRAAGRLTRSSRSNSAAMIRTRTRWRRPPTSATACDRCARSSTSTTAALVRRTTPSAPSWIRRSRRCPSTST